MLLFRSRDKGINAVVEKLPVRYTHSNRLQNVSANTSMSMINVGLSDPKAFLEYIGLNDHYILYSDMTDGLRITLNNNNIVHLRPSGNAPELRCYAEADSSDEAYKLVETVLANIKKQVCKNV